MHDNWDTDQRLFAARWLANSKLVCPNTTTCNPATVTVMFCELNSVYQMPAEYLSSLRYFNQIRDAPICSSVGSRGHKNKGKREGAGRFARNHDVGQCLTSVLHYIPTLIGLLRERQLVKTLAEKFRICDSAYIVLGWVDSALQTLESLSQMSGLVVGEFLWALATNLYLKGNLHTTHMSSSHISLLQSTLAAFNACYPLSSCSHKHLRISLSNMRPCRLGIIWRNEWSRI